MRTFFSVALAFAMLATAGVADAASRVFIIHGIPGVHVDVYARSPARRSPPPRRFPASSPSKSSTCTAGPATVDIRIYAQGANPQTAMPVIAVLGAAVPGPRRDQHPRAPRRAR